MDQKAGAQISQRAFIQSLVILFGGLYNTHGHKLHFPDRKKAQFLTALGIIEP
jgi:hypothetical protein